MTNIFDDDNAGSIIPTENMLPDKLLLIPLQSRPIFPGIFTPLMINAAEDVKVVEKAYEEGGFIGIVMLKNDAENPAASDMHKVGTAARILKKVNLPDGGINIFVSTVKRFKIRKVLHTAAPVAVAVEYLEEEEADTFEVKALTRALLSR